MEGFIETEGWWWQDYASLESTNDKALELSEIAGGRCLAVSAESQTAGRGRRGRAWSSLEGNLFMSLVLPFELSECGILAFMLSLALLNAVRSYNRDVALSLKWPNDVLLNGKKISGILLEKGAGSYIVAGIGVNLRQAPQLPGAAYEAASLTGAGIETERKEFLRRYLAEFNQLLSVRQRQGNAAVIGLWRKNAAGIGRRIAVHLPQGDKEGIFAGLDDNGMLILQTMSGREIVSAGDVFFIKKEKDE